MKHVLLVSQREDIEEAIGPCLDVDGWSTGFKVAECETK